VKELPSAKELATRFQPEVYRNSLAQSNVESFSKSRVKKFIHRVGMVTDGRA
jgi:hypothetical protein